MGLLLAGSWADALGAAHMRGCTWLHALIGDSGRMFVCLGKVLAALPWLLGLRYVAAADSLGHALFLSSSCDATVCIAPAINIAPVRILFTDATCLSGFSLQRCGWS